MDYTVEGDRGHSMSFFGLHTQAHTCTHAHMHTLFSLTVHTRVHLLAIVVSSGSDKDEEKVLRD